MLEPFKEFTTIVKGREYGGLSMHTVIEPDEWHQSMPAAIFAKGLKYIYSQD